MDENGLSDYHNLAEIDSTILAGELRLECQSFFCPPEITGLYFGKHGRRYRNTGNINEDGISEEEKVLRKCVNEYVVDNFGRPFLRIMYPGGLQTDITSVVTDKITSCLQHLSGHRGTLVMQPFRLMELLPLNVITPVIILGVLSWDTIIVRIWNNDARNFEKFATALHEDYTAAHSKGETCTLTLPANWNSIVIGLHPATKRYCRGLVVRIFNGNEPPSDNSLKPYFLVWWLDYGGLSLLTLEEVFKIKYKYLKYRTQALPVRWLCAGPLPNVSKIDQNRTIFEELFRCNIVYALNLTDRPCCTNNCVFLAHTKADRLKEDCPKPDLRDLIDLLAVGAYRRFVQLEPCVGDVEYPEEFEKIQKFLPYKKIIDRQNALVNFSADMPEKSFMPNARTRFYEEFYTGSHPARFERKTQTLNCKTYGRPKDGYKYDKEK